MGQKETAELEFHRETITAENNSPLHLIREKEIEISGRILAAKRSADEVIAKARREAVALVAEAQGDASHLAEEHDAAARAESDRAAEQIRHDAEQAVAELEVSIAIKQPRAVSFVMDAVLGRDS